MGILFLFYLFYLKYLRPYFKLLFGPSLDELAERELQAKRSKGMLKDTPKSFKEMIAEWEPQVIRPPLKIGKYVLNKKYVYRDVELKVIPTDLKFDFDMVGKSIDLIHEPTNEYDPNAISVQLDGTLMGYIPNNRLQSMIHDFQARNQPVYSILSDFKVDEDTALIEGITIFLGFYHDPYANLDKYDTFSAKLVKTSKKDFFDINRQENYGNVSEGDYVDLEYDFEAESYMVSAGGCEIGETSAFITKKLQDFDSTCDFIGIIDEIIENYETEKFGAKITIYLKEM